MNNTVEAIEKFNADTIEAIAEVRSGTPLEKIDISTFESFIQTIDKL